MNFIIQFPASGKESSIRNSKGNQTKLVQDNIWYKLDYLGYEGASETVASALLAQSNVTNFVHYQSGIVVWNEKTFLGCASVHFLPEGANLITADQILRSEYGNYEKQMEKMSSEKKLQFVVDTVIEITGLDKFGSYVTTLLELDALILNEDRHLQNIAVLYHETKGYEYCPIFDNGAAFLSDTCYDYPLDQSNTQNWKKVKAKPFSTDFQKQKELAESVYGVQLSFDKELSIPQEVITHIDGLYETEIVRRIIASFQCQKKKYPELFTGREKRPDWDIVVGQAIRERRN